jgi:formiminoglutamase
MVTLKDYFDPISIDKPEFEHLSGPAKFSHNIAAHTDNRPLNDIGKYSIAIIGVPEGRNSIDPGSGKGPDIIREKLYNLSRIPGKPKIIDLGNMKKGAAFNDTLAGLTDVLTILNDENVFPVIIGGSSALIPAIDRWLSAKKNPYTMVSVDSRIDFNSEKKEIDSSNYLYHIIYNHKSSISHFINIGYQSYLNDYQVINRFNKKQFDLIRIGDVRQAIHFTEPLFRDADATVIDISAVRQSDAPGTGDPSPNGFYGEEICLLARYAGISDQLKVLGLFDVNPDLDIRFQTSGLAAQILWFFFEGFSQKQLETPSLTDYASGRFKRYHVRVTDLEDDLIFVKSNLTDRWWIEIHRGDNRNNYVACSYEDYLKANRNEVPDRWVRAVARLK